jgi:hypothetical protein
VIRGAVEAHLAHQATEQAADRRLLRRSGEGIHAGNSGRRMIVRRNAIPGYTYGTEAVAHSPITMSDFELLKVTAMFTDEDLERRRVDVARVRRPTE